jgi:pimeloyl-ACP methyl ester carboxylesterase
VAGHDTGFAISYALAADHPERVDRVALAEIPGPPGTGPAPPIFVPAPVNDRLWHIPFNRVEKLPEQLITGREDVYFGYEFAIQGGNCPTTSSTTTSGSSPNPTCARTSSRTGPARCEMGGCISSYASTTRSRHARWRSRSSTAAPT